MGGLLRDVSSRVESELTTLGGLVPCVNLFYRVTPITTRFEGRTLEKLADRK